MATSAGRSSRLWLVRLQGAGWHFLKARGDEQALHCHVGRREVWVWRRGSQHS